MPPRSGETHFSFTRLRVFDLPQSAFGNNVLAFLISFVWAKSIDNADSLIMGQYENWGAQDERNLRLERGLSFFDVRYRFSSGFVDAIPAPNAALKNWQLSGNVTLHPGTPLNPVYFATNYANSGTPNRPNIVPGQSLLNSNPTADHYYHPLAISAPAPCTFGDAGRDILPGPGNEVLDLAQRKFACSRDHWAGGGQKRRAYGMFRRILKRKTARWAFSLRQTELP